MEKLGAGGSSWSSDLVPPARSLVATLRIRSMVLVSLVEPHAVDEHFGKAWMPFFCRSAREWC